MSGFTLTECPKIGALFIYNQTGWSGIAYTSRSMALKNTQRPVMTDKVQDACGNYPGDNIVDHDPHAAMHIAIKPADRPRLPHIQNTENHKPGGNPLPVIGRQRHERDPHTNKFVPDNAAMIVHTHVFRRLMTKIDADTDPQHHHQRVELPGQKGHQIPERDRRQRSHRARNDRA